jgi:hypothetical protein
MHLREVTQRVTCISEFIKLHLSWWHYKVIVKTFAMVCGLLYDFPSLLNDVIILLPDLALVTYLIIPHVVLTLLLELMKAYCYNVSLPML